MKRFQLFSRFALLAMVGLLFSRCENTDLSAPILSLLGPDPQLIQLGDAYVEEGAEALDDQDGTIGAINTDISDVNTDVVGKYEVIYTATDKAGNTGTASRDVWVWADNSDLAGVYSVTEDCDDGNTYTYDVTITASGVNPNLVLIENFGDYGVSIVVEMTLGGDLNDVLDVNDNEGGADFLGTGNITNGTTTDFEFDLSYSADDGMNVLNCDAVFTKQ